MSLVESLSYIVSAYTMSTWVLSSGTSVISHFSYFLLDNNALSSVCVFFLYILYVSTSDIPFIDELFSCFLLACCLSFVLCASRRKLSHTEQLTKTTRHQRLSLITSTWRLFTLILCFHLCLFPSCSCSHRSIESNCRQQHLFVWYIWNKQNISNSSQSEAVHLAETHTKNSSNRITPTTNSER